MEERILWEALSLLRLIWCLTPQKGYLHPDEFFQSPEVMAGDILDLDINRPWEFLSASPCRTVLIPLLTSGALFFGCLHQAGLIPSLFHIQHILQSKPDTGNMSYHHTILFTHTYMPPHYLLSLKKGQTSVNITDLAGFNKNHLCQKLQDIHDNLSLRNAQELGNRIHKFLVVFPGTVAPVIENCGLVYKSQTWFTPHLSMEDPPKFSQLLSGNLMNILAMHVKEVEVPTTR
ncbi:GPI mannosyltransferase 4 isoform X2 [Hyperolius riggenbachi]|uniref:GPI mannosyltransferase 4 isoform X2 n=1 Tax=Hyperolius riggenbachi TaxID=752182 RepID=UPI0035A2C118